MGGINLKLDNRTLIIDRVDLDHILDIDELVENRQKPPSIVFLEHLAIELEMNGISKNNVDEIKIKI